MGIFFPRKVCGLWVRREGGLAKCPGSGECRRQAQAAVGHHSSSLRLSLTAPVAASSLRGTHPRIIKRSKNMKTWTISASKKRNLKLCDQVGERDCIEWTLPCGGPSRTGGGGGGGGDRTWWQNLGTTTTSSVWNSFKNWRQRIPPPQMSLSDSAWKRWVGRKVEIHAMHSHLHCCQCLH